MQIRGVTVSGNLHATVGLKLALNTRERTDLGVHDVAPDYGQVGGVIGLDVRNLVPLLGDSTNL